MASGAAFRYSNTPSRCVSGLQGQAYPTPWIEQGGWQRLPRMPPDAASDEIRRKGA